MNEEQFSREALCSFEKICENAHNEQKKLLMRILEKNKDTEYGRKYHFADIRNPLEYAGMVPLTAFEDYEEMIRRQIQGENDLMAAEKPVFYCISAGSTGTPKYLPITGEDAKKHHFYEEGVINGVIREYFPDLSWDDIFGCIFEIGEYFRTYMEDGTPNGVRSGIYRRCVQEEGGFDVSTCCVPWEVYFPEKLEDILYVKVRFALNRADITGIQGVFAHKVLRTVRFIEKNWELLLHDMEYGCVSGKFGISREWEEYLIKNLPANSERAESLRSLSRTELREGMLKKIWPSLTFIRVIGGSMFQMYTEELKIYASGVPMHFFAYAASESYLGVAREMECQDAYVLLADTCFYEFLPVEAGAENGQMVCPVTISEVETGKQYELIITTLSGLYRYHLGDVVEVVGRYGQAPVIRICYRLGQGLNLADENINVSQMETAMDQFLGDMGRKASEYCFAGDYGEDGPGYRLYLESAGALPVDAEKRLDECLGAVCLGYKSARDMGELKRACITLLPLESFLAYEQEKGKTGMRTEQRKPVRVLKNREEREAFLNFLSERERTLRKGRG